MNETDCPKGRETLSAYFDGELSAAEREAFERHLAEYAECREQLKWLEWTGEVIRALPEREPEAGLQARCRGDFERELGLSHRKVVSSRPLWAGWAVAVAASIVLLLGFHLWLRRSQSDAWGPWTNASASVTTRLLADGSTVKVAPGARVAWQLEALRRLVVLYEGEIALEVEPDERPFLVRTPSGKVEVVGTRFRVKVFPSSSEEEAVGD